MVATEASGMQAVIACQRRQSQLTTAAATGQSRNMWLMVCGWVRDGAPSTRAACLLGRGSANVGSECPAHHTAMQYAPPQNHVLPVEEGQLPELTPLGLPMEAYRGWLPNAPSTLMVSSVAALSDGS